MIVFVIVLDLFMINYEIKGGPNKFSFNHVYTFIKTNPEIGLMVGFYRVHHGF